MTAGQRGPRPECARMHIPGDKRRHDRDPSSQGVTAALGTRVGSRPASRDLRHLRPRGRWSACSPAGATCAERRPFRLLAPNCIGGAARHPASTLLSSPPMNVYYASCKRAMLERSHGIPFPLDRERGKFRAVTFLAHHCFRCLRVRMISPHILAISPPNWPRVPVLLRRPSSGRGMRAMESQTVATSPSRKCV